MTDAKPIRHPLPDAKWPTKEEAEKSLLFSPCAIGSNLVASNRAWVPAMVPWRATEEGFVTPNNIAWYERFAMGQPGVIVIEATGIRDVPSGPLLRLGHDRYIEGMSKLVDACKVASEGESKIFVQLIDFLGIRRRPDPQKYFERFMPVDSTLRSRMAEVVQDDHWLEADESELRAFLRDADENIVENVLPPRELESLRYGYRERVQDMHLDHIRDLPQSLPTLFADAAERAKKAGFDGVELHYAHAYTMASFLSRLNMRDDGYGGSQENRLRLPLEVFAAVRERVGEDYVVGCRFLGDEVIEGGSRIEDAVYYGRGLAKAGMDFLSISKGGKFEDARQPQVGQAAYPYTGPSGHECMPTVRIDERGPFLRNVHLADEIRKAVRADGYDIPVVTAGGVSTYEHAEGILQADQADFVGAARQSLADPDWWLKTKLGRGEEVRRCVFTNYCEGLDQKHKEVTCQLWDRKELDEEGVTLSNDQRRRLLPPPWQS